MLRLRVCIYVYKYTYSVKFVKIYIADFKKNQKTRRLIIGGLIRDFKLNIVDYYRIDDGRKRRKYCDREFDYRYRSHNF